MGLKLSPSPPRSIHQVRISQQQQIMIISGSCSVPAIGALTVDPQVTGNYLTPLDAAVVKR